MLCSLMNIPLPPRSSLQKLASSVIPRFATKVNEIEIIDWTSVIDSGKLIKVYDNSSYDLANRLIIMGTLILLTLF